MSWKTDPLFVCTSKFACTKCNGGKYELTPSGQYLYTLPDDIHAQLKPLPEEANRRERRGVERHNSRAVKSYRLVCDRCKGCGYEPINLAGFWHPRPGFLVCGGPSLSSYPLDDLRSSAVWTLGVNNAGAYVPCKAFTYGDGQEKFHHNVYFNPGVMTFTPAAKLSKKVRIKSPDGQFHNTTIKLADCPNVFGISRSGQFDESEFLTTTYAHWGHGGKGKDAEERPFTRLASMLMGVRLMHYLGCPRAYMIGVDFHVEENRGYAWGDHASCGGGAWGKIDNMLTRLRPVLEESGMQLFNCNEFSRCRAFDFVPFHEALADCRGPSSCEPNDLKDWYSKGVKKEHQERNPGALNYDQVVDMMRPTFDEKQ